MQYEKFPSYFTSLVNKYFPARLIFRHLLFTCSPHNHKPSFTPIHYNWQNFYVCYLLHLPYLYFIFMRCEFEVN
jgi:hypothetical protein